MSCSKNDCPKDNEKYKRMGVTPEELYLRQNGICHLELFIDEIEESGHFVIDDLYCTNMEDFALTKHMLNPTYECMVCLCSKMKNMVGEIMESYRIINKFTVDLLQAFSAAEKNSDEEVYVEMSGFTLLQIKGFIEKTFIYTEKNSPIKKVDSTEYLFGKRISIRNSVKAGQVVIQPGSIVLEV